MDLVLPEDLLRVIRLSVNVTTLQTDPPPNKDDRFFDPKSPRLRRLVEEILFSRWFVVTYYGVLGVILVTAATSHWIQRWKRTRTKPLRLRDNSPGPPTSSSSGTTLQEHDDTPTKAGQTERSPLLGAQKEVHQARTSPASTIYRRLTSSLTHQPRPIPSMTAPANHLPDNATTVCLLLLLGVNVFYLFYHMPLSIPMLFAFADRAGLCFVMNLPVLYVLAAKTNQPLKMMTGWSYEAVNIFHRRLGEWMTILAALHGAGMMGVWYTLLRPLHFTLLRFLSSKVILLGIITLVAYFAIYVTSTGWVRSLFYERFLIAHIVLQVTALVLLFFHHGNARPYVLASLAIWTLDRVVSRMVVSRRKFVATLQIAPDEATVLLFCDVPISKAKAGVRGYISHGWEAGQHIFITVPGIGWQHQLQAHPFTIASPAPPSRTTGLTWPLQLTIRAQDGFSKDLLDFAKFHQHAEVVIDGPYGSTDALEAARAADSVCLIAGGSGIAVTYPLAWELSVTSTSASMVSSRTIYENGKKVPSPIASIERLSNADKVTQIWVRQDHNCDGWITAFPRQDDVGSQRCIRGTEDSPLPSGEAVVDLITSKFETGGKHYRPDLGTELGEWASAESSKELPRRLEGLVVIVSGPDGLVRDVRNATASLQRAGYDIAVYVEKFGWS